ncbi:MAG: tetratricopeptide repeat protein [Candidatus Saccharicenans sp.]|uniref:tetratricopeptide repeat protein n=1 Tax=Candidatus Saccharicenans sp. TaxID=2819258 RepID=UPI00404A0774
MGKKKKKKKLIQPETPEKLSAEVAGNEATARSRQRMESSGKGRGGFKSKFFIIGGLLLALGVLSIWYLMSKKAPGYDRVAVSSANILLITLDTTRADHLGCYGYKEARTPNLDRLAREGIRFARAYCPAPLTLPSHTTILTGLEPFRHQVRNNGHYLPANIRTVTEILKERGFRTAAFVSSFSVDSRFGLDRGFELYDDTFQADMPFKTMNAERRAGDTFSRFARWLENNYRDRFFCWVHYYDPHLPYDPPAPYDQEFSDRPYDGEIAYMDVYVGRILQALEDKGLLDKTVIIVAGDHGEGLGSRVELGHGIFLYEETVRVPLIFWGKKVFSRPGVVEERVRLTDLAPTILSWVKGEEEAAQMQGRSLEPFFRGREKKDRDTIIETFYPRENFGWSELIGIISGRYKLIQSPRPELFDLKSDPEERRNLFSTNQELASELKQKLESMVLGQAVPGSSGATRPEDLERLRSLGYLNLAPARGQSSYPDPKEKIELLKLIQQAQAYEFEEKYDLAEQAYWKIMEEVPDSPASYVNLALALAGQKKMDRAVEVLQRGLDRLPYSEILLTRLGHTYAVSGKYFLALRTMEKVLELNARNLEALTVSAGILDAAGRKEEAWGLYRRALEVEPESKSLRTSLAASLASAGKFAEAIEIYKRLIEDFPEDQSLYQFTGLAYSYLGDHEQAIFYLRQAVAILPTRSGYYNLAVAYEKAGRTREAVEYFRLYLENSGGDREETIRLARRELQRLEKKLAGY